LHVYNIITTSYYIYAYFCAYSVPATTTFLQRQEQQQQQVVDMCGPCTAQVSRERLKRGPNRFCHFVALRQADSHRVPITYTYTTTACVGIYICAQVHDAARVHLYSRRALCAAVVTDFGILYSVRDVFIMRVYLHIVDCSIGI